MDKVSMKSATPIREMDQAQRMNRLAYIYKMLELHEQEHPEIIALIRERDEIVEATKESVTLTKEPCKSEDGKFSFTYTKEQENVKADASMEFVEHLWNTNRDALKFDIIVEKLSDDDKRKFNNCLHRVVKKAYASFRSKIKLAIGGN